MLFLGIISWKGASRFNGGGCFSDRGFLSGGSTLGASVLMEGVEKNRRMGGGALHAPSTIGNPVMGGGCYLLLWTILGDETSFTLSPNHNIHKGRWCLSAMKNMSFEVKKCRKCIFPGSAEPKLIAKLTDINRCLTNPANDVKPMFNQC